MTLDYKKAGVDVEAGDKLVDWLQETQPKDFIHKDKIVSGIGGFASLFRVPANYKKPLLVSGTDGVGTKLKLAFHFQKFDTLGQDLVGMCVNDILTVGAEPLFFLDYFATGKLELEVAKDFLKGLRAACAEAKCALVGGETAEMPGFYTRGEFDVAGFAVGVVEEDEILGKQKVKVGDVAIGVSSSGFHSNGYSLIRKVFEKDLDQWKDVLLKPTALYTQLTLELKEVQGVHAYAHITGGGMENIPRVMPKGTELQLSRWEWPLAFKEVQSRTQMTNHQMLGTLNCGIGWVVICDASAESAVKQKIKSCGFTSYELGTLKKSDAKESVIDYRLWEGA